MNKQEKNYLDKYCRNSGIILIILGVIHFLLPQYLMFSLGALLIFLGVFSLIFRIRVMFIIIGVLLVLIGLWNIFAISFSGGSGGWTILGIFQIYWGFKEIKRFFKIKK